MGEAIAVDRKNVERGWMLDVLRRDQDEAILEPVVEQCQVGNFPNKIALAVDHDHKWKYRKVRVKEKWQGPAVLHKKWKAFFIEFPHVKAFAKKKNDAIRAVRKLAIRQSVRGIICFGCNGGLRKFRDNHRFLASASKYLKHYEERCKGKVC